jgi:hypothetical protein
MTPPQMNRSPFLTATFCMECTGTPGQALGSRGDRRDDAGRSRREGCPGHKLDVFRCGLRREKGETRVRAFPTRSSG